MFGANYVCFDSFFDPHHVYSPVWFTLHSVGSWIVPKHSSIQRNSCDRMLTPPSAQEQLWYHARNGTCSSLRSKSDQNQTRHPGSQRNFCKAMQMFWWCAMKMISWKPQKNRVWFAALGLLTTGHSKVCARLRAQMGDWQTLRLETLN